MSTDAKSEALDKSKETRAWWTRPTIVAMLTAIVASVAPLTTAVQTSITAQGQVKLEQQKHVHAMRQQYLERVLNDKQSERVLEFLLFVEEDKRLRKWAEAELKKTTKRILLTKNDLYTETIQLISRLADLKKPIDEESDDYIRFWELYKGELISVESKPVELLMVSIGKELEKLSTTNQLPSARLKELSFEIALTMKREMQSDSSE